MINLVTQPDGSSICGHCCVAMITGLPLMKVIRAFKHVGGTTPKDVNAALVKLGWQSDTELQRISGPLPAICICKVSYDWRRSHGHWVVHRNGLILCPSGETRLPEDYTGTSNKGRITSYIKVWKA